MNNTLGVIRRFNTKNFIIEVTAEEEYDLDLSFDEDGSIQKRLQNGDLIAFCAKAEVIHRDTNDRLAIEYLCNCIYKNIAEFQDHKGADSKYGSYFKDMVTEVCDQARVKIAERALLYSNLKIRRVV